MTDFFLFIFFNLRKSKTYKQKLRSFIKTNVDFKAQPDRKRFVFIYLFMFYFSAGRTFSHRDLRSQKFIQTSEKKTSSITLTLLRVALLWRENDTVINRLLWGNFNLKISCRWDIIVCIVKN